MVEKGNKNMVLERFQHYLSAALLRNYGRIPSAAVFADDFNLRAVGTTTVTRETTRKWINGITLPTVGHIVVLVAWLNLDVNVMFGKSEK